MTDAVKLSNNIKALLPDIELANAEMEAQRRLPAALAKKMAKAGLFRLITPKSLGGFELSLPEIFTHLSTVSQVNASAGWCSMIACTNTLSAAYLSPTIAKKIFGDPEIITGGIFAPSGIAKEAGDDYILTGHWRWGSGSANTQWMACGARIEGRDTPPRMLLFSTSDCELVDSWHVAGLKGTGSGDIIVKDLKVPKERSVALGFDKPVETGPLYTFPPFCLLAIGVAAVAYGNAAGALESFNDLAGHKKTSGASRTLSERETIRVEYAKATARLRAAHAYVREEMESCWAKAIAEGQHSLETRSNLRLACTHLIRTCADVTRMIYEMAGGPALFLDSDLQRRFRDGYAMTQHIITAPATYDLTGRILLGLPTKGHMV